MARSLDDSAPPAERGGSQADVHRDEDPTLAAASPRAARSSTAPLALAALGVVFGDIGTSPLYAFRQCFIGGHAPALVHANVLGVLSLITWALIGVVCVKYTIFILRADHEGEGGTLALLALLRKTSRTGIQPPLTALALMVLFGSAMLYGDGVITPAISVISAVEGLSVATTAAQPFIVPITAIVLLALFAFQPHGTGKIGAVFGPVMLVWFLAIGILGLMSVLAHPQALAALNPVYSWELLLHGGPLGFEVMGAVVLCVSGVEALYADLAHFGRTPIRIAWYVLVLPALLLNYYGQGALLLSTGKLADSTFYALVPGWGMIPMVLLATVATVIASQALISGAFSLTQQAIQLGYLPRLQIIHTSRRQAGQVYIPAINVLLTIACLTLVFTFRSSDRLAAAYGLAVTVTMLATTITYYALIRTKWRWPLWRALAVTVFFLSWDLGFLAGNVPKVLAGGWVPLTIAIVVFTIFITWTDGRRRLARALAAQSMPVGEFLRDIHQAAPARRDGTALFLTAHPEGIPFVLRHHWMRSHVVFETIVLLTIVNERRPYIDGSERVAIEQLAERLYRITVRYGFMEIPAMTDIFSHCRHAENAIDIADATFYLARPRLLRDDDGDAMPRWKRGLYAFMLRNAKPLTDSLDLPAERIVELGVEIKL